MIELVLAMTGKNRSQEMATSNFDSWKKTLRRFYTQIKCQFLYKGAIFREV